MRQAADLVVAALALLFLAPVWWLPWRAATALGRLYGYAMFVLYPAGRRTGQINLRRMHGPSMTRAGARRAVLQVFGSLGAALAEGLQFARRYGNGEAGWDACFDIEDADLHARVISDPRPKVFVTAHLGSWEVAMMAGALRLGSATAIVRRLDNRYLNALFERARGSCAEIIDKRGGAADALAHLRGGRTVALLLDENGGHRGVWVNFLGRPASTHRTAALLACSTRSPIVVGAAVRRPGGRFLYRLATIEPPADASPDAVREVTSEVSRILSQWIADDPLQWRWVHWRWKTRPDGTEERYGRAELRSCFEAGAATTEVAPGRTT